MNTPVSFDNTEVAFAYRSNKELRKSKLLFSLMSQPWLVKLGTQITPWTIQAGMPVKGLIRNTIFSQFVGGESLDETIPVANKLAHYGVQVILDYGVEGKEGEKNYDGARDEFIRVIQFASTKENVPFMTVKVTGLARFALLEKLDTLMHGTDGKTLLDKYKKALLLLTADESNEWHRVHSRISAISEAAKKAGIGFLIDAEETWIQDPVDALTTLMMEIYNREKPIVYNTFQLYRHDRLQFLKDSFTHASDGGYILGAKLVRGAYMEKERKRAQEMNYPSPIQPDKKSTDRDYDDAIRFSLEHIDRIGLIVASHNEQSNLLTLQLLDQKGLPHSHPHVHFSQLFGMSDNITFNLAKAGCNVSKYLPFGPIRDVIPYLMRRAQENTSVGGQTTRELNLIKTEIKRRKI